MEKCNVMRIGTFGIIIAAVNFHHFVSADADTSEIQVKIIKNKMNYPWNTFLNTIFDTMNFPLIQPDQNMTIPELSGIHVNFSFEVSSYSSHTV